MACGIAGLSVAADSLSAIKYATVTPVRDERGLVVDYVTEGDVPDLRQRRRPRRRHRGRPGRALHAKLRRHPTYRDAVPTQSVLTITSNVVYGKATGNTPDGRRAGRAVRPGRQPDERTRHARDARLARCRVAKLPYAQAQDGISLTITVVPAGLGRTARRAGRATWSGCSTRTSVSDGLPHERQRAQPRDARGRHGAPGELPAADDPGVRATPSTSSGSPASSSSTCCRGPSTASL